MTAKMELSLLRKVKSLDSSTHHINALVHEENRVGVYTGAKYYRATEVPTRAQFAIEKCICLFMTMVEYRRLV